MFKDRKVLTLELSCIIFPKQSRKVSRNKKSSDKKVTWNGQMGQMGQMVYIVFLTLILMQIGNIQYENSSFA